MKRVEEKAKRRIRRKKHIRKNITGTASRPRMTVYRSSRKMYVQVIDDNTGNTVASISTMEGAFKEWRNNVENAAKLGAELGKRLMAKNISTVVFDRNGYLYHGIVKNIAEGARKSGIKF